MPKKKTYIPKPAYNPIVQAQKIENTKKELAQLTRTITLITESNERHYQLLGNFARHDIKNIVINLNSVLELYKNELPVEASESIQLNIKSLSSIVENLSKLIPHSDSVHFKFNDLLVAVRILTTPIVQPEDIHCTIEFDTLDETDINLPFQAILQMVNNLLVNAIKAIEENKNEKTILIKARVDTGNLIIEIKDNGCTILPENKNKIFDFGFSTTGGSGIGLNHAKFLCKEFNGELSLDLEGDDVFEKSFVIKIPIKQHGKDYTNN